MNRFLLPGLAGGMLLSTLVSNMQAVGATILIDKGGGPEIKNVVIANQNGSSVLPQMDNLARGGFDFRGAFGDGGTAVQWR